MTKKRKKHQFKKKTRSKKILHSVNFLAPEFVYYKKSVFWYIIFGLVGVGLEVLAIWQRQWYLAIIVFLAGIVFLQYSKKRPKSKKCHLNKDGLKIDNKFFPLSRFRSFSIDYDRLVSYLFLETVKRFNPPFWLNIKNKDLVRVIKVLKKILPEKPTNQIMITKINRWIKF